jgi:hypothetical protein
VPAVSCALCSSVPVHLWQETKVFLCLLPPRNTACCLLETSSPCCFLLLSLLCHPISLCMCTCAHAYTCVGVGMVWVCTCAYVCVGIGAQVEGRRRQGSAWQAAQCNGPCSQVTRDAVTSTCPCHPVARQQSTSTIPTRTRPSRRTFDMGVRV